MQNIENFIESNREEILSSLFDLLKIPSISAQQTHCSDMLSCAKFLQDKLLSIGLDKAEILTTDGAPVVYGEKKLSDDLPTILVYGHYDVQPVEPLNLWLTEPFSPVIKKTEQHPEGAIFCRGANDDKGQLFMHLVAFEYLNKNNLLSCNVKFLFEGEEEIGSVNLDKFLEKNKEKLSCDVVLVSDTAMIDKNQPSVMTGLRGLCYLEIKVTGPNRDLHSGHYGGAVINPLNEMCRIISLLHNENKQITIPNFYDDVIDVSDKEREELSLAPFNEEEYKKSIDIKKTDGETGFTTKERATIRPSLDLNGIWGGYTGEGAKTIIPSYAEAKISIRLVPGQEPEKISEAFIKHFKNLASEAVKVEIKSSHGSMPYITPSEGREYQAAIKALEQVYGKKALPIRGGGSIGVIPSFEKFLGKKTILLGFGLQSDAIHSPNEHFCLDNFFNGIKSIVAFYKEYAK